MPEPKGKVAVPGNNSMDEVEPQAAQGLGPWMLVQHRRSSRHAHSFCNQQQPALHAKWAAIGDHPPAYSSLSGHSKGLPKTSSPSGTFSSPVALGQPASAASMEGSPHLQASPSSPPPPSLPPVQEGPVQPNLEVGGCLHSGDGQVTMKGDSSKLDMVQSEMNVQVQDQASCMVQQDDSVQPIFGGFSAMPSCIKERSAPSGAAKWSNKRLRKALLGGKSVVAPLPSLSSDALALVARSSPSLSALSQALDRGLCELPMPDLSLMVQDAPLGTIAPYFQRLYVDEPPPLDSDVATPLMIEGSHVVVEDGMAAGQHSLKVERMLKDLGPVSSLPRKRRLIALDPGGGGASPSLPS